MAFITTTANSISSGGTINGDIVIEGDLTVNGAGAGAFDEIIEGTQVIDVTNTEALLVRKNGDGGDIFTVDTTNSIVKVSGDATMIKSGAVSLVIGSSNAGGASISLDGDSNGDGAGGDYSYIHHDTAGILNIVQDSPSGTNEIRFGTAGTEDKITIDASGNLKISSTNKLEFGDTGTYIHQSADGTLDLVADTILELNGGAGSMKIDANSKISLSNNDSGTNNTLFGKSAGASIVSGANDNVLIGPEAGDAITIGDDNIAIGNLALSAETVGQSSVAIGTAAAGNQAKSGASQGTMRNTAVGTTALYSNVTGTENTFLGADAGYGASGNSHTNNTGLGFEALKGITTGDYNVAVGSKAGIGITAHDNNIAIGQDSLRVCGNELNIAIGVYALEDGSNGYSNIAIGGYSLKAHATNNTVAIGESALQKNTSGIRNTALGYQTLVENTLADGNTAVGFQALKLSNKTGSVGVDSENTAVGSMSSSQITTGIQNTSLGSYALGQTVDSDNNTAIGYYALGAGDVSAGGVTAIGALALAENINGEKNTAVGFQAGNVLTAGDNNTIVGYDADTDDNSAVNQTVIGCETTGVADNSVTLGNASVTAVYMAQDSGAMVHSAGLTTSGAVLTQGMSDNTDRFVVTDDGSGYKGGFTKKSGSMGGLFVRGSSSKIGILTNSSYAANPSGDTEAFMVSSADASATFGGNVGIGGTPSYNLHITGTRVQVDGDTPIIVLKDTSAYSQDTGAQLVFQGLDSASATRDFAFIQGSSRGSNDGALDFYTRGSGSNTLRMRIDEGGATTFNGLVDITDTTDASDDSGDTGALRVEGGASIAKKLYVGGTTSLEGNTTISSITTMVYETNQMVLTRDGGHLLTLLNAGSAIADGESLGYLRFNGNENSSGEVVGGEVSVNAEGDWTNNTDCPTKMSFYTNPGDGMTEYMRLTKSGNVLLNDSILSIYSDDYAGTNYEVITMNKADGGSGFIKVYKGGSGTYRDLEFQTGGSTRLTIASGGAVTVAGALSKGSGSFKIDHPLESKKDTHHLVHSFVEGPQADNIYRGKVNLSKGTATINIDEVAGMTDGTFVALNREIQCFTSNESDWDAVKGSVSGNILTISCQNENSTATISWLVIGERQDKHMMDTDWTDKDGKVIVEPLKQEKKSTDHVEGKDPLDEVGNLAPNQRP